MTCVTCARKHYVRLAHGDREGQFKERTTRVALYERYIPTSPLAFEIRVFPTWGLELRRYRRRRSCPRSRKCKHNSRQVRMTRRMPTLSFICKERSVPYFSSTHSLEHVRACTSSDRTGCIAKRQNKIVWRWEAVIFYHASQKTNTIHDQWCPEQSFLRFVGDVCITHWLRRCKPHNQHNDSRRTKYVTVVGLDTLRLVNPSLFALGLT